VIHRDLKPSNILLDAEARPRVMDFGIASRIGESGEHAELVGTPAYMAPEYIAQRIVGPQCDVFAAGLILYEMVFGRRAIEAPDVFSTLNRVANAPIELPADPSVDDRLRDIIAKATARDPAMRYRSAPEMREALENYASPDLALARPAGERDRQGALDFLLRRMRLKSDFPALSEAIGAINRLAASDKENVATVSNSILKDFALTNKLLRLVNAASYRQAGGGSISTVSRAIMVLGFDAVRNIAFSLILFEHLRNKKHAARLKEDFLRATAAAMLARNLAAAVGVKEPEEAFICALFHDLGRLLTHYYFPDEADEIARLAGQRAGGEDHAAIRVLGMTYAELGVAVSRSWGFPATIVHSMRPLPEEEPRAPANRDERLRALAGFATRACALIETVTPELREGELARLRHCFRAALPMSDAAFRDAMATSADEIAGFCGIVRIDPTQTVIGRQLLGSGPGAGGAAITDRAVQQVPGALDDPPPGAHAGQGGAAAGDQGAPGDEGFAADAQAVLAAGIQDISNALVEDFSLNDVLRIILETMYRAMRFRRVVLCVRDGRSGTMCGRFGFGEGVDQAVRRFRFRLGDGDDIFNVVLSKGVDVLISDAGDPQIAARVPAWYRECFAARTFIVFPLLIRNAPVAMIYADREQAGDIVVSAKELALLRTLRNQAILAIKQSS
jgi:HD-like signal output (HDOD) protein